MFGCRTMEHHTKVGRLLCSRCSKTFKSPATLKQHFEVCFQRNSEPRFSCEICLKRFRTEAQFSRHCYYTHAQRSFVCGEPGCGRAFPSQSHLKNHSITHTTDRPYVCPVPGCHYRARNVGRLAQHKVIHGQGRRFACEYCDYSATTSSNLRRHARIHAGSLPYLCPHCDHRTSELNALKKHVLDSGQHPGLPLYVCPWCQPTEATRATGCVGFNASNLAWRHLIVEHSDEIAKLKMRKTVRTSSMTPLLEREVTRLLGIYCPDVDSTQPPVDVAVRQPAHLSHHRRRLDIKPPKVSQHGGVDISVDHITTSDSSACTAATEKTPCFSPTDLPREDPVTTCGTSVLSASFAVENSTEPQMRLSARPTKSDFRQSLLRVGVDSVASLYNLVQLGSGALWSKDALSL
ncbi:Zinc finger protein [Paragonimus heterotremus]|uniref:Zinc finger protein n=1 Tax=Paragonimus heterotremus TaxID=100268 RepID=A0A8J4WP23_9TREM|nr:Zinc finger protein [Paragonimus heterotremus]